MESATPRPTCVALAGRAADPRVAEAMRVLAHHLVAKGHSVKVAADEALVLDGSGVRTVLERDLALDATLVVAVGGDGTMLHAARMAAMADVPVLGVNRGRLGFLADVGPERMLESVDDALAGRCHAERRMLLTAHVMADGRAIDALALNDVVVTKKETGRTVDVRTWVNGAYVNTHGGDGFIVATPTGSTAYSLSAGGPIVRPTIEALLATPISPHTLAWRPLLIGAGETLSLRLRSGHPRANLTLDGQVTRALSPDDEIQVRRAPRQVPLIVFDRDSYYDVLRTKLAWAAEPRGARADR
jgi:NAD+ kinase